jgi:hypothetical protein
MPRAGKFLIGLGAVIWLVFPAVQASAANASGALISASGTPLADYQLHFENQVSGDIYLIRTGADGSFSADLPPGVYDLRAERGLVLRSRVMVGEFEVNVGQVTPGAPLDVRGPFEREGIGPALVQTQAPATAHLTGHRSRFDSQSPSESSTIAPPSAPDPGVLPQ